MTVQRTPPYTLYNTETRVALEHVRVAIEAYERTLKHAAYFETPAVDRRLDDVEQALHAATTHVHGRPRVS